MRYLQLGFIALAFCASATKSLADKAEIYGFGTTSCGKWIASSSDPEGRLIYTSWVLGWLSAAGVYAEATLRETDSDAVEAWIDNYCRDHPLDPVSHGASALVKALARQSR